MRFHVLEYHKRHFPGLYCLKKTSLINGNFSTKPWVNPFGKMSKMPKKKKFDKWPFLHQNHGLTPLEKCQFLRLFELFVFIA